MNRYIIPILVLCMACSACKDDPVEPAEEAVVYDGTPYTINTSYLPPPPIAEDNPLTVEGVKLGRMLFFEPLLSSDNSMACASCHLQEDAFSDVNQFSIGVEGLPGGRQAMAIFNMAYHQNGFFWDGRAELLRHQSLMPIEDPLEMNETLENVGAKLSASQTYKDQFVRAFNSEEITAEKMSLAMEQFMNSIVSVNSKYDRSLLGLEQLTEQEERGRQIFFTEFDPLGVETSGECFHCHGGFNFTNDQYQNNGLDPEGQFEDEGLFAVTGDPGDMAKFKVPSLRNIAVSAPYMHDGRFNTLEEVIEHYNSEVHASPSVDTTLMQYNLDPGLGLEAEDIADLVAFLHTLTDETFLTTSEYGDPFE